MKREFNDIDRQERKRDRVVRPVVKGESLLRLCPDCGKTISYYTHFKAFMHGSTSNCAYMENQKGKRIWDNKMREEALTSSTQDIEGELE